MILTIDAGNTNITLGLYEGDDLIFVSRLATEPSRTADQYAIDLSDILALYRCNAIHIDGAVISSVVPPLNDSLRRAVVKVCSCKVLVVSPGIKTGLNIKIDDPSTLGSDLACCAVAAKNLYPTPCIVIDLGTATKLFAIDENGALIGGVIYPGIKISLEALAKNTAALPLVSAEPVSSVLGTNTIDSMRGGIMFGTAAMIDGLIEQFENELKSQQITHVVTGGFCEVIAPYCKKELIINQNLILEGLKIIYNKNVNL